MSVRTNWVESAFAFLNGAATFVVPEGSEHSPIGVELRPPQDWPDVGTSLPPHPSGEPFRFQAPDYDTLVDSPILLGDLDIQEFQVDGVPHFLISQGGQDLWDFPRAAEDCRRIVEVQTALWGTIPYSSYRFLNVLSESGGGLEHANSTLVMASRFSQRDRERYRGWLGLISHEFFHTWNVKRLRPVALGPFDYSHEVHTPDLWVVEGLTSYFGGLCLARAGLIDRKEYLKGLSKQIEGVQTTPGREVQALSASSHDAWTHYYQRNENSRNTSISYYTKGAVVGFLLDAEIRRSSGGERSLDDAMRLAYSRYSGERGYTPEEFRACLSETAGRDLSAWLVRAIDTTEELDYEPALEWFGLRFHTPKGKGDRDQFEDGAGSAEDGTSAGEPAPKDGGEDRPPGWIGLIARDRGGRLVVSEVRRHTIAEEIGLNVDDEIIAVDRYRVPAGGWAARMKQYAPGDTVTLLVARRGELMRIPVTLGEKPEESWKLEVRPDATSEQRIRLARWLGAAGDDLRPPPEGAGSSGRSSEDTRAETPGSDR